MDCERARIYGNITFFHSSRFSFMPNKLVQLQQQIAKLQRQAEAIQQKEVDAVIGRIKQAIAHYGLTAADLGLASGGSRNRRAAAKPGRKPSAIKFRDEAGNTWSGHGRRPRWYLDAIAAGKTPRQLAA